MKANRRHWVLILIIVASIVVSCQMGDISTNIVKKPLPSQESDTHTAGTTLLVNTPALTIEPVLEVTAMVFQLTSPEFSHKSAIPAKFTCKGKNVSPELLWTDPPKGTASYGLILDDPDAPSGTWVHWVMYNIPEKVRELPEAVPSKMEINNLGVGGMNSWSQYGYGGPCPPIGTHRYFFRLYALDKVLDLKAGGTKADLIKAMQGHILAVTELMGTFTH